MGITDLRQDNSELFNNLGALIGKLFGGDNEEQKIKEEFDAIMKNPALRDQLTSAARERQRAGVEIGADQAGEPPLLDPTIVSPEVLRLLLQEDPETDAEKLAAAKRKQLPFEAEAQASTAGAREANILEAEVPFEQRAKLAGTKLRGEQITAETAETEAEFNQSTLNYALENGLSPETAGNLMSVQQQLESVNAALDLKGMRRFTDIYDNASEHQKQIISASIAGGRGAGLVQDILQEERLSTQALIQQFQDRLKNSRDPFEVEEDQLALVLKVIDRRDKTVEEIKLAIESGDKDQLTGLVAEINYLAETLLRIDPNAPATTVAGVRRLLDASKFKGVEFGLTDVALSNAEQVEEGAKRLAEGGNTPELRAQMEEDLTDPRTGRLNTVLWSAVTSRALEIMNGVGLDEDFQALAATEAKNLIGNPAAITNNQQKIDDLISQYDEAMTQAQQGTLARPQTLSELGWKIRFFKLLQFFATPPDQQGSLSIPRTPEERKAFEIGRK